MALNAYLAATQALLQNPVPANPLYTTTNLTSYINEARQQLAGDGQCIRASSVASLIAGNPVFPFSTFTTFGYEGGFATGYIAFSVNPSPGDTITLNGVVWEFVASGASGNQTNIQGTTAVTLTVLQGQLAASVIAGLIVATYSVTTGGGGTTGHIIATYKTPGSIGDSYTLAASAAVPSGATLTGGFVFLTGIQGVLTIRQLGIAFGNSGAFKLLYNRPWPWFNRYFIANGTVIPDGTPTDWSQLGLGTVGTFGVGPAPSTALQVIADVCLLPVPLVDDTTPEAIPYPFTDAIQYYAAYKAYLSSQKTQDAQVMFNRYKEYVQRAVQETAPSVLANNFLGGIGAQIAASKQSMTLQSAPAPRGGQGA